MLGLGICIIFSSIIIYAGLDLISKSIVKKSK
jgi:hypothetical protein|nr:MAG TPA_asm: hypothetical protein [Caudoviricetes sp.]